MVSKNIDQFDVCLSPVNLMLLFPILCIVHCMHCTFTYNPLKTSRLEFPYGPPMQHFLLYHYLSSHILKK